MTTLKDHELRELIDSLRDIAVRHHSSQQLRAHIAYRIAPYFRNPHDSSAVAIDSTPSLPGQLAADYDTTGERDAFEDWSICCDLITEHFTDIRRARPGPIEGVATYLRLANKMNWLAWFARSAVTVSSDELTMFEQWADKVGLPLSRFIAGGYESVRTEMCWQSWLASAIHQR